jgi:hypothetical protein
MKSNVYTAEQLQHDVSTWLDRSISQIPRPDKAIADQFQVVIQVQKEVVRSVAETRSVLETAKAFLKDPKGEGIRIVKDAFKAMDRFFANLFKLLTKDVGAVFMRAITKYNQFILAQLNKFASALRVLNNALKLAVIKEMVKLASRLEKSSSKLLQSFAKLLQANAAKLIRDILSSFTKSVGPSSNLFKTIAKNSQALAALKELPKAMSGLAAFAKLGMKMLPILGAVFDLKWKNETRQYLIDIKRQQDLNAKIADRQFSALATKIKVLESKNTVDYTRISSAVKATIPTDLARTSDIAGISQGVGSVARSIAALKIPAATVIDYSRIQNGVTSAVNAAKAPTQSPTVIDYARIQNGVTAAVTAAKPPAQTQTIDYTKVAASVTQALSAASLSPSTISDAVVAKTKAVTSTELDQILERQKTAERFANAAAINQALNKVKLEIPSDLARKADVEAISNKISKQALDLSPVLSRLTTIDNTLVNLGQRFKPVDINPLQDKLNQLQNGISQLPGQVTNNLSNFSNSIVSNLSNFITNNNTTIVNKMAPALNPDTIINPIKTHINTQVAQPLATTMEVLNVNDLKRGVTMSAEAVIKASGFQQYGQAGTATATNLIGLTAMIAAPLFMRAGFHQLGTAFPKDIRNPMGEKVTPTTSLSTSQWQFNQVSNLIGIPTTHLVTSSTGAITRQTFQNQAHTMEEIHAQNLGIEQDISAVEKYCHYLLKNQEMMIQMILQNKHDIDVLVDESGAKTEQKIILRPGLVTHSTQESFFDKLMTAAQSAMVVRTWKGDIDAKQLALKTNMEAQVAALSNKFEFDKTDPKIPIVDRQKQNPKTAQDEEWKRYVNTSENPGTVRQSLGMPIPEIKEIKFGSQREVTKPTTDPDKLLGS